MSKKTKVSTKPADKSAEETKKAESVKTARAKSDILKKADFVAAVADKCEFTKSESEKAINAVFEVLEETFISGKGVTLQGIGSFSVAEKAARDSVSFGKTIHTPAHKVVKFKMSKNLGKKL